MHPALASTPPPTARFRGPGTGGADLVAVKDGLWRVTDPTGNIMGHIERRTGADGERFTARRLLGSTRVMELGNFWRIDEAADCFR
jgi:hypothetical protein